MGNLIYVSFFVLPIIVLPIIVLVVGIIFVMSPPQKTNSIVGYMTSTSMKNNDTWIFAQKYSAKALLAIGVVSLVLGVIVAVFLPNNAISVGGTFVAPIVLLNNAIRIGVTLVVQIVLLILVIPLTETALKKNFDNAGNRKEYGDTRGR